jgi:PAS domain S-box-containing protein
VKPNLGRGGEFKLEQARLAAVFDSVPEGVVVTDVKGHVLLANPAANKLCGRAIPCGKEFNSDGYLHICHPDGTKYEHKDFPLIRSVFDCRACENIEMVFVRPDGRRIDILANTAPIIARRGEIAGAVGIFQNVTAMNEAQEERQQLLSKLHNYTKQLEEINEHLRTQTEELQFQKGQFDFPIAELKDKKGFLEIVFDQIPVAVFIADARTGKIVFCNKQANSIIGRPLFPMNEVEDLLNCEAFRPDGSAYDREERPLTRSLKYGETVIDEELRFQRPDGSMCVVLVSVTPLHDANRQIVAAVGTFHDVTEKKRVETELRKHRRDLESLVDERTVELKMANVRLEQEVAQRRRTEEALIEQSAILEAFFVHAPIPLVILDRHFNFLRVNEGYAKACQRDMASFRGRNHFELYPHKENEAIFKRVVATKTPFHTIAKPFVFPDHPEWGTTYWDWSLVPIMDTKGEVELLIFSLSDVTQHKKAQEEIARLSQFRETVIDTADVWLCVTDENSNMLIWNRAAEKISGYRREEVVGGKKVWRLLFPEHKYRKDMEGMFSKILSEGKPVEDFEAIICTKSGESRTILWNARPINGHRKRTGLMAVGRDITERKETEEKMRRYQRQLRSLASQLSLAEERLRRRVASDLHDGLGQLLAVSKIKLSQLRQNTDELGISQPLAEIHQLVEDAIGFTRSLTIELSPPVLHELGFEAGMEWLCEQIQRQHNIQCSFKSKNLPQQFESDLCSLLFQIIRELMHNVAKHAQACTASITVEKTGQSVRVNVVDDGVGFDIHEVSSRSEHAQCFGLFNIRERLEHLGGRLEVNSTLGRGTSVTVIAPVKTT